MCVLLAVVVGACGGGGGSTNDAGPRGGASGAAAGDAGSGGSGHGGAGAAGAIGSGGGGAAGSGGGRGGSVGGGLGGTAGSAGGGGSAVGGIAGAPPACTGSTIIAPDGDGGIRPSAVYGPNGELHVAYVDGTTGQPRHAFEESGAWTDEIVDDLAPGFVVYGISAAVDARGRVHVAYVVRRTLASTQDDVLFYAQRAAAGGWSPPLAMGESLDTSTTVLIAIGLDGDDEPCLAWTLPHQLGVDRHSAAGWTVQSFPNTNNQSAIAVATDGSGRPWIFSAPILLVPSATGYTTQNVPVTQTGYLAVSAAGDTVYVGSGTGSITFGMGALWTTEVIPGVGSLPYLLAQTTDGKPVAAYTTAGSSGGLIAHVTRRDAGWVAVADYPFVAPGWNGPLQPNYSGMPIALDAQLHPAIVAPTDDNNDLRMFELGPQGQATDNINIKLRVASARGAVDGGQGRLVVAYYGDVDTYVAQERAGGGFDATKVGAQGLAASLMRDAQGKLWLAATRGTGDMGVVSASSAAGPWTYESLATFSATGKTTQLVDAAVGPDGRPHVLYQVDLALWHAVRGESPTQVISAVDSTQPVEGLFDGAGTFHVVYGGDPVLIVRWSGSVWQTAMTNVIRGALAFADGAGHVCAVGPHSSTGAVTSVCLVGSTLVTTTLAEPASSVQSVSLAADGTLRLLLGLGNPTLFPADARTALVNATTGVTERLMPLVNDASMVVPTTGAVRIIYYDKATARLYVLGC